MRKSRVNVGDVFNNDKYGPYEILFKNIAERKVTVKFLNTGGIFDFNTAVIYTNSVKDYLYPSVYGVGCLGESTVNSGDPLKNTIILTWKGMMGRCYNPQYSENRPTYVECVTSQSWTNQVNFKAWFIKQIANGYYQDGWELDKDLLFRQNKIYSEETCVFLPQRLNQLQQVKKDSEYNWLPGVNFDKSRGKFKSEVNFDGKRHYFPRRETEMESFLEYKELKEKLVRADAENWKGIIDPRAYESLKNYSLDWVLEGYKE